MLEFEDELKGRTIFVTGADGFVGSHLIENLLEYGCDIKALVEPKSSLLNLLHVKDKIKIFRGDLLDYHSVSNAVKSLRDPHDKPIVFHLAAQAHVGESWERPVETIMTNVVGTFNILQALVEAGVDVYKFDYAGTAEEFGHSDENILKDNTVFLDETSDLSPRSIYATTKLAGDFLTLNFFYAHGLKGVITRMFNNYGPRQGSRYITGTVISQALSRDKILLGNLSTRRDFCFIEDGVRGHMHVALKGKPGEVYCYGYGQDISIGEWTQLIVEVGKQEGFWKDKEIVSTKERFRIGDSDVLRLKVGFNKLNNLTGWKPLVSWEEGIKKTIKWYAENPHAWRGTVDW